jgi:hypothetical protein
MMKTSLVGPVGVLLGDPTPTTTKVDEDVNSGPPRRCLILSSIAVHSGLCKKDVGGNDPYS